MVDDVSDSNETFFCDGFCVDLIIPSYEYLHCYYHAFASPMKKYVCVHTTAGIVILLVVRQRHMSTLHYTLMIISCNYTCAFPCA